MRVRCLHGGLFVCRCHLIIVSDQLVRGDSCLHLCPLVKGVLFGCKDSLNGTLVRGRSYTLNEEQKKIFNDATQDISLRIGSIHLV